MSLLVPAPDIFLFDLTNPRRPKYTTGLTAQQGACTDEFLPARSGGFYITNMCGRDGEGLLLRCVRVAHMSLGKTLAKAGDLRECLSFRPAAGAMLKRALVAVQHAGGLCRQVPHCCQCATHGCALAAADIDTVAYCTRVYAGGAGGGLAILSDPGSPSLQEYTGGLSAPDNATFTSHGIDVDYDAGRIVTVDFVNVGSLIIPKGGSASPQ